MPLNRNTIIPYKLLWDDKMPNITKSLFLSTLSCPTYGWMQKLQPIEPTSPSDQLRIEEGIEIQQRARLLFPNGVLISGDNIYASKTTQSLLSNSTVETIFEATFLIPPYITKADILLKNNLGLKIIEIKSAVNLDEKLIDDISYTTMIAKKAGFDITSCSLLLVNKDYRLGMSDKDLFVEIDVSQEVFDRCIDFEESYESIAKILFQKEKPIPELKWECKNCEIFSECCGKNIENSIFNLPRLSHTKFCQLKDGDEHPKESQLSEV